MQISNLPTKYPIPFASGADVSHTRTVPQNPTGTPGQASLQLGFPPENFNPVAAGGVPPFGQDFNGIINSMTSWLQWVQAGFGVPLYDGAFSTVVGGYPNNAIVQSATTPGQLWISLVDNNLVNPDSGPSVNWFSFPQVFRSSTTFYVNASTGSDAYDGTSATVSGTHGPWATGQHAANVISQFNLNGNTITVNFADSASYANINFPPITGVGLIKLIGNVATPGNVQVTPPNGQGLCGIQLTTGNFYISGFRISSNNTNNYDCINMSGGGCSVQIGNVRFGASNRAHIFVQAGAGFSYDTVLGSTVTLESGANGLSHIIALGAANLSEANPPGASGFPNLTVLGACSFTQGFLQVYAAAYSNFQYNAITGGASVTGPHFNVYANGIINANGLGTSYYPGSVAGIQLTGGQYY